MRKSKRRFVAIFFVPVIVIWITGCLNVKSIHSPDVSRNPTTRQTGRSPIIIIPGVLGSLLKDKKTGKEVWPRLNPDHDELSLPISPDLKSNRDDIAATEIIGSAQLEPFSPEVKVYQTLIDLLVKNGGYKLGNIDNPSADGDRDTLYPFPYDWRRDIVESAELLAEKIASLKQKLGRPDLKFDIVAHSTGGLVARYYLMYGGADLTGQNFAKVPWTGSANIDKLILVGTPNEGSTEAFRTLVEGYSSIRGIVKRILRIKRIPTSVLSTMPSGYQLLPHPGTEKFYDSRAVRIVVDLYNIETWRQFRWGIYDPARHPAHYRPTAEQESYLKAVLDRARLFDQALDQKTDQGIAQKIFILGGDCQNALSGVFIIERGGQHQTVFRADQTGLSQSTIRSLMFQPGDGTVTRLSAGAASRFNPTDNTMLESYLTGSAAEFGCAGHAQLFKNQVLQDGLLSILLRGVAPPQSVRLP